MTSSFYWLAISSQSRTVRTSGNWKNGAGEASPRVIFNRDQSSPEEDQNSLRGLRLCVIRLPLAENERGSTRPRARNPAHSAHQNERAMAVDLAVSIPGWLNRNLTELPRARAEKQQGSQRYPSRVIGPKKRDTESPVVHREDDSTARRGWS